ncbi:UNVERIFIED_CONTAM: protein SUPPRESSOR OF MAX2 1 [Sesamum latifolium]|uniref:Protein SUPPRESSOR OF MAX2 1 n=1 Tax=Sesamum latifolium TaxID=2727402 RepID=A0AAW2XII7_9LAMI
MRAGLSTIQQTLTPEAASVLNQSIAEASRRNHGQTTPLHPPASVPRVGALFQRSVGAAADGSEHGGTRDGPISNALMAALKRAQAHQRRGCPEQQQQPLLAVKVELEQLIISILDDPSVSRVMREASFSSPAVKATIEQSLNNSNTHAHQQHHVAGGNVSFGSNFGGIGPRMLSIPGQLTTPLAQNPSPVIPSANRNVYLNPRLQQGAAAQIGSQKGEEVKKVLEIMVRSKKRNPVLVGDSEPEALVKEFLRKVENKELGNDGIFKNVQVLTLEKGLLSDKNQIAAKIKELGGAIETGEFSWVQQQQKQPVVSETGRAAVVEMTRLLARFGGGDGANEGANKLWFIGTATCETYLRCQVYHSTMENDWDLQAAPIASRSPLPGMFPSSMELHISDVLWYLQFLSQNASSGVCHELFSEHSSFICRLGKSSGVFESLEGCSSSTAFFDKACVRNSDPAQRSTFCPQCSGNYEKELARLAAIEKSLSAAKQEMTRPSLPQWLQNAKLNGADAKTTDESQGKDQGLLSKQKTQELQKKWRDTCLNLHPNFHQAARSDRTGLPALSMTSLYNPNLLSRPPFQPKLQTNKPLGEALQLNMNQVTSQPADHANSPPASPVRTDLVLGRKGPDSIPEKATGDQAKDFLGCISSEPQTKLLDKFSNALDADTYKKLLKGLMEKAWWQAEAASAVASAITRCRLGNGKRRGAGSRATYGYYSRGRIELGRRRWHQC